MDWHIWYDIITKLPQEVKHTVDQQQELPTYFEFPCLFPVKVMADKVPGLQDTARNVLQKHGVALDKVTITERESSGGKYLSLTLLFEATSKAQLDALYHDLVALPQVKMVL